MNRMRIVATLFCLAVIVAAVVMTIATSCLPMHGNPRCFACTNCANGTLAEDPKCAVGPCAPGQHEPLDGGTVLDCVVRNLDGEGLHAARVKCEEGQ